MFVQVDRAIEIAIKNLENMGSCISSSNYSDNSRAHYYYEHSSRDAPRASRIENDHDYAAYCASRIEKERIQSRRNSEIQSPPPAKTYEELRKRAEIELGYAPKEKSEKLLEIRQVCCCNKFHILYRGSQEDLECAHLNESDWRKSKFEKLCEDCMVMRKFNLYKENFHPMYMHNDKTIYTHDFVFHFQEDSEDSKDSEDSEA